MRRNRRKAYNILVVNHPGRMVFAFDNGIEYIEGNRNYACCPFFLFGKKLRKKKKIFFQKGGNEGAASRRSFKRNYGYERD